MTSIDIIILVPLIWGAYKGFKNGIISEFAQFAGLVLGFLIAFKLSYIMSSWLIINWNVPEKYVSSLSFVLMFIAVLIAIYILARILEKLIKAIALEWLNKIGGLAVGGLKYLLIIGIILNFIINLDRKENIVKPETKQNSIMLKPALYITDILSPHIKDALFANDKCENNQEDADSKD